MSGFTCMISWLLEHALVRAFVGTGRGGIKRFSSTVEPNNDLGGCGESQLGPCICSVATREVTWYAGVAKPGQRDPSITGLGSAGLRRLSRRGSWVRIPPPAPKKTSTSQHLTASSFPLASSGTRGLRKSHKKFFSKPSFCLGWILGLFWRIGALSACL